MNTEAIAHRLIELCRQGQGDQAQNELYADDAVSVEMEGMPAGMPVIVKGIEAIREKGRLFNADIEEMHGGSVSEPLVSGNWFSVVMTMDATFKHRGRVNMQEICVYRVKDGKIVHEQFFYDMG
ncbi:MAG: nuclear transport factor 2 family protein [Dokdonella sp.]